MVAVRAKLGIGLVIVVGAGVWGTESASGTGLGPGLGLGLGLGPGPGPGPGLDSSDRVDGEVHVQRSFRHLFSCYTFWNWCVLQHSAAVVSADSARAMPDGFKM